MCTQRVRSGSPNLPSTRGRGASHFGFIKLRNTERLSKELNTTIHLLNLTVQGGNVPRNEDWVDSDYETARSDIGGVDDDWQDEKENVLRTIENFVSAERSSGLDCSELPLQIQQTIDASEEAIELMKQLDISADSIKQNNIPAFTEKVQLALKNAIQRLNGIIDELQDQICDLQFSECEAESVFSISSLATQADENCCQLGLAFQSLYDVTLEHCLNALSTLDRSFEFCKDDMESKMNCCLSQTLELMRLYRQLDELERSMSCRGIGPVKLFVDDEQHQQKLTTIQNFIKSVSGFVVKIQDEILNEKYMKSSPLDFSIGAHKRVNKPQDLLKKVWNWIREVYRRSVHIHPELKREIFTAHLDTILDAANRSILIQTTPEVTKIIQSATSVEQYEILSAPEDEIRSQAWLLPCIRQLHSHAKELVKELDHDRDLKGHKFPQRVALEHEFYQLIPVTISRMSKAVVYCADLPQPILERRRRDGMATTRLIQKYLAGPLVKRHIDVERFESIKQIINNLITNICSFNSRLQLQRILSNQVPVHALTGVILSNSGETSNVEIRAPVDPLMEQELSDASRLDISSPFVNQDASLVIMAAEELVRVSGGGGVQEMSSVELCSLDEPLRPIPTIGHFLNVDCKFLRIVKSLESGSSANVYLMDYFGAQVAVKVTKLHIGSEKAQFRIKKEAEIHQRVHYHPHIVRYFGKYMDCSQMPHKTLGIIMEYCDQGNLMAAIKEARWIMTLEQEGVEIENPRQYVGYHLYKDWVTRLSILCNVAAGMAFLHHLKIVHRDLTSYNILLHRTGQSDALEAKICDFERSNYIPDGESIPRTGAIANSPPWSAPEVLNHKEYTTQADVFSMGVLLWELMYLEDPWERLKIQMCRNEAAISCLLSQGNRLPLWTDKTSHDFPEFDELVSLVKLAWRDDPQERPTMTEFYKSLECIKVSLSVRSSRV
eukprot:g5182.t1